MQVDEEVNAYRNGNLELYELSPEARGIIIKEDEGTERFGWEPNLYVQAAGVTMPAKGKPKGYRQEILSKVELLCSPNSSPAVRLIPDPNNPYDKYAVEVHVATSKNGSTYGDFENAGFLPRGRCPHCGRALTGKTFDNSHECPTCHGPLRSSDGSILDSKTEFNRYILQKMEENKVKVSVDKVVANAPMGASKRTMGLTLAFYIED
jgi:hypothetical protein